MKRFYSDMDPESQEWHRNVNLILFCFGAVVAAIAVLATGVLFSIHFAWKLFIGGLP